MIGGAWPVAPHGSATEMHSACNAVRRRSGYELQHPCPQPSTLKLLAFNCFSRYRFIVYEVPMAQCLLVRRWRLGFECR